MSGYRKFFARYVRSAYVAAGFNAIATTFFLILISFFNEDERKHTRNIGIEAYALAALIAFIAGVIEATEDNHLQGKIISESINKKNIIKYESEFSEDSEDEEDEDKEEEGRTWKSNIAEILYMFSSITKTTAQNLFSATVTKAWIEALRGTPAIRAVKPLNNIEIIFIVIFSLLVDALFNLTTAGWEVSAHIKKQLTGSPKNPLLHSLLKPLANPIGKYWVMYVGAFSHVMGHLLSLTLCIPPQLILKLHKNKDLFAGFVASYSTAGIILMASNASQTYLFESLLVKKNLDQLHGNDKTPLLKNNKPLSPFLYRLLITAIYLNLVIHGADETLPVIVFTRYLFNKVDQKQLKLPIGTTAGILQFFSNALGTLFSEAKEAKKELKIKRRSDIETGTPMRTSRASYTNV